MAYSIIGEFSVLSPSQKRELEQKRREKEARETAAAIRRAEAARKAREAAKLAEEKRLAAIRAENAAREAAKESKKNILRFCIAVLCVLIIIVVWVWIHYFNVFCVDVNPDADVWDKIVYGVFYFMCTSIVAGPILAGIGTGIEKLRNKIKALK